MSLLQFHVFEGRSVRGMTGIAISTLPGTKQLAEFAGASRGV